MRRLAPPCPLKTSEERRMIIRDEYNQSKHPWVNKFIDYAIDKWQPDEDELNMNQHKSRHRHEDERGQVRDVEVSIYFHESFSSGGHLFTVDVRNVSENGLPDTGSLIHRERISVVNI